MSEVPEGWKRVKLGDVGEIRRGASPRPKGDPRYFGGTIPWIKISDLSRFKEGIYLTKTEDTVTEEGKRRSVYLPDGSLIVSNSGTVGEPAIIFTGKGGCIHDGFITIKPRETSEVFLYYLFEWKKQEFQVMAQANTQGNMNTRLWAEVEINLPPLPEQRKIAEVLSKVDSLIEKTEKIIEKYERIKRGLAQDLLTRGIDENGRIRSEETHEFKDSPIGRIPKEWKVVRLGQVSFLKARIGWQGLRAGEYLEKGDYYLVTGINFKDGKIDWDSCVYVSKRRYDMDPNIQLKVGDVLVTKDGTIGKVAYVEYLPKPATLGTGVFVLRPINGSYDPLYMYHILTSFIFERFMENLKAGSTITHLYQKDFVLFEFPLPPLPEQRRIAQVLSQVDNILNKERKELEKLKRIKRGLMNNLLSGKIRVTPLLEASE